jgi:DNA polymerase-3 subunit gamma/tau
VTQALYRRYRPETFAEVIGQEHVTEPLMQALRADKITHAYLFSGPRGCGKTTSARILARCLNCEQGPTPTPCGTCPSCVELGRGGPGSLDVVEIDAASHNGVDDARDLRERAAFAPARDRYKIFILDEAHMVTPQGFNALLKIVEEPPPHVKFIFATTEPDKVIGTIRSRTHHYPFRLVAPDTLNPYLEQLCAAEGVEVGSGVLPLVVRAGGGSVRDSLSVLDQLVAGAGRGGLDYESAVALLGYTHSALLDDVVGAIGARDGASAFRVVDRVVSSGHEPRRFVEDLLERLRDLIVIAASGESARAALRDLPADQLERMRVQAATLGPAELSRSADLVNAALTEMTGATSPRLHLELLVARLLLPAVDDGGVVARLEHVERAVAGGVVATGGPSQAGGVPTPTEPTPTPPRSASTPSSAPTTAATEPAPEAARPTASAAESARAAEPVRALERARPSEPSPAPKATAAPAAQVAPEQAAAPRVAAPSALPAEGELVRSRWPEVLQTLRGLRTSTWVLVSENAQVAAVSPEVVELAFRTPQLATTFRTGPHPDHVRRALHETLGLDARVEPVLSPSGDDAGPAKAAGPAAPSSRTSNPTREQAEASWGVPAAAGRPAPAAAPPPASDDGPSAAGEARGASTAGPPAGKPSQSGHREPAPSSSRPRGRPRREAGKPGASADPYGDVPDGPEPPDEADRDAGPGAPTGGLTVTPTVPPAVGMPGTSPKASGHAPARSAGPGAFARAAAAVAAAAPPQRTPATDPAEDASPDDPELTSSGLVGAPLVAQMLGGTVIDEIPEPPA